MLACPGARAANEAPAIEAFDTMFAGVNDYTRESYKCTKPRARRRRIASYSYSFMKPHYVKTLIIDGDGKGGGGVWTGGDQVSGHQGGILSGIHLKISVNDPRAVSLRGSTIPEGLLQNIVDYLRTIPGKLTQIDGGKVNGVDTDRLEIKASEPGLELRRNRPDSLPLERDALASPADHVLGFAGRARRKRKRPQNERRPYPKRFSILETSTANAGPVPAK